MSSVGQRVSFVARRFQVPNPSAANDEGITALHNAICAGHLDIVRFLVELGCDVNAQDSDGWYSRRRRKVKEKPEMCLFVFLFF